MTCACPSRDPINCIEIRTHGYAPAHVSGDEDERRCCTDFDGRREECECACHDDRDDWQEGDL